MSTARYDFTKYVVIVVLLVAVTIVVSVLVVFDKQVIARTGTANTIHKPLLEPNTYALNLETAQQYGVYVNSVCAGDVDNDGVVEIITGGQTSGYTAQLRIWNWDGYTLTLEHNEEWQLPGGNALAVQSVCVGDVDNDGRTEIITAGSISDVIVSYGAQLRIWNWYSGVLTLEVSREWYVANTRPYVRSVCTGDIDNDRTIEIITVGDVYSPNQNKWVGELKIWNWVGTTLTLEHTEQWQSPTDPYVKVYSVCVADVDADGRIEIITGGMTYDLRAELRIWNWYAGSLTLEREENWYIPGSSWKSSVRAVSVGDVDSDGRMEIVTGAFFGNGSEIHSQLRIWNWYGGVLTLEKSEEWFVQDHTAIYATVVGEIDRDLERPEIITVGTAKGVFYTSGRGEIRVFDWNSNILTLENRTEWDTITTNGLAVYVNDADGDTVPEILVGGCADATVGELRIWSVGQPIPEFSIAPLHIGVIAALFIVWQLCSRCVRKRRR